MTQRFVQRSHGLAALATLLLLSPALAAQTGRIQRDAEFLRGLAKDLGFVSLAQDEVERLKQTFKDSPDFKSLVELDLDVTLIGARRVPDREARRTLFKQVLERAQEVVQRYANDPVAERARGTLAEACYEYGRFLVEEIAIAEIENPDRIKTLEEEAANVFRTGVDVCDTAMKELRPRAKEGRDEKVTSEYYLLWLRKGILLREHGRAVKKDRPHLIESARNALEELVLEVGEETALGLRGLFEYSICYEVVGDLDEASRAYRDTIEATFKALTSDEVELKGNLATVVVEMMEEAYDHLTTSELAQGKPDQVLLSVAEYRDRMKKLDAKFDDRWGDSIFITEARAMAESGDPAKVAKALEQAREYNARNANNLIGQRAKQLIGDILNTAKGVVSGADLLEVAKGEAQARRYEDAVAGFKRAIASLTPAEEKTLGLVAWHQLGRALAAQERFLEAVLAIRTGLEKYTDAPEDVSSDAAEDLERAMRNLRAQTKNDPYFDALDKDMRQLAATRGGKKSEARLYWDQGLARLAERKWAEAAELFAKVPAGSDYWELSQSRLASALQRAEQLPKAREAITRYREFLKTPLARLPDNRKDLVDRRARTVAEMDFLDGYMIYLEAFGGRQRDKRDPTRFPAVISSLSDYKARHGQVAPDLLAFAYDSLARTYVEMGDIGKAEEMFNSLRQLDAKSTLIPALATRIYSAHEDRAKAAEVEFKGLRDKNAKPEEVKAAQGRLDQARRAALALGVEYLRMPVEHQFEVLTLAMRQAEALQSWDTMLEFGQKIIAEFGTDKTYKERVDKFVKASVGEALLRQLRFREAKDLLVDAEKADPKNYPVKRLLCRAMGGWQEIDARGSIVPVAGLGEAAEAYQKYWDEYRTYALATSRGVQPYSYEWYEFHWECYHFAREAAKKDSKFRDLAQRLYNIARSTDEFATLRTKFGLPGETLYQLFMANQP